MERDLEGLWGRKNCSKNQSTYLNPYFKVSSVSNLCTFCPTLALSEERLTRQNRALSGDTLIEWQTRTARGATLPLEVYYSIFSSYCIYYYMPCTRQHFIWCVYVCTHMHMHTYMYTHSMLNWAVRAIASLLKISSMQCNYLVCRLNVSKSEKTTT